MIQLICEDGYLYTPRSAMSDPLLLAHYRENPILIKIYDEGDCDTIKWPDYDAKNLRSALYDARETGCITGYPTSVLLPDGTVFEIE